jgi:hypothetical protein
MAWGRRGDAERREDDASDDNDDDDDGSVDQATSSLARLHPSGGSSSNGTSTSAPGPPPTPPQSVAVDSPPTPLLTEKHGAVHERNGNGSSTGGGGGGGGGGVSEDAASGKRRRVAASEHPEDVIDVPDVYDSPARDANLCGCGRTFLSQRALNGHRKMCKAPTPSRKEAGRRTSRGAADDDTGRVIKMEAWSVEQAPALFCFVHNAQPDQARQNTHAHVRSLRHTLT